MQLVGQGAWKVFTCGVWDIKEKVTQADEVW
jgi:hypothetical protein